MNCICFSIIVLFWLRFTRAAVFTRSVGITCVKPELSKFSYLEGDSGLSSYLENTVIQIQCLPGFELLGVNWNQCTEDGWRFTFPDCEASTEPGPTMSLPGCLVPKNFLDGAMEGDDGRGLETGNGSERLQTGSTIRFRCHEGLELVGPEVVMCQDNGKWETMFPKCYISATDPPNEEAPTKDGRLEQSKSKASTTDTTDKATTPKDALLEADDLEKSRSKEITCARPQLSEFSYLEDDTGLSSYFENTVVRVKCHPGYELSGVNWNECTEDGWRFTFPDCKANVCLRPSLSKHSFIENDEETETFPYGAMIQIRCTPGYQMVGLNWNQCTEYGWNFEFLVCREIVCPDPGTPENSIRDGPDHKFPINSTITFTCSEGYQLSGSRTRTCLSNGQWDGALTTCSARNGARGCKNPGTPINGHRAGKRFFTGSVVTFSCFSEFIMSGSAVRACLPSGQWNGTETLCRSHLDFDRPEEIKFRLLHSLDSQVAVQHSENPPESLIEARSLDTSPKEAGSHLVFYFVFDSSNSVGETNFNTSTKFAAALVKRVGVTRNVHVGAVTYGKTARVDIFPLGQNTEESVLKKLREIQPIGGGTATVAALEEVRNMVSRVRHGINGTVKSTVFLLTDGFSNIGGHPGIISETLKKMGVEIFVLGLIGQKKQVKIRSLYDMASSPRNVFYINQYNTLLDLVDVLFDDSIDYSRCGLAVTDKDNHRVWGGKESVIQWPWMASITFHNKVLCGGSIIDNSWILTAAHCFEDVSKAQEQEAVIIVGSNNRTSKNDDDYQTRKIERKWIHRFYKRKSHLDFDVAVIKLSSPLKYGKYVRRICLPPDEADITSRSSLYRTGQLSTILGWGIFDDSGLPSPELREVDVYLEEKDICLNDIRAEDKRFITDSMLCARVPEGGNDACKGDSGGPLMQKLDDSGTAHASYWVQVGVTSWGIGVCGKLGGHSFYTNVAKVVGWIKEVVAERIP